MRAPSHADDLTPEINLTHIAAKIFFCIIAIIPVGFLVVVIHEGAHYVVAKAVGIHVTSVSWLGGKVTYMIEERTWGLTLADYAGGLVAGSVLLITVILKRNWFQKTPYHLLVGMFIAGFGVYQVVEGSLEGASHDAYMAGGLIHIIAVILAALTTVVYYFMGSKPEMLKKL